MTKTTRGLYLKDLFKVTCNKCGSDDVDLHVEECGECGSSISAECNKCGLKYDYHDFKHVAVEYDNKGKEIWNDVGELLK